MLEDHIISSHLNQTLENFAGWSHFGSPVRTQDWWIYWNWSSWVNLVDRSYTINIHGSFPRSLVINSLNLNHSKKPSLPEVLELPTHLGKCHTAGANSLTHRYVIVRKTDEKESIFNQGYNYTIPMLIGLFSRPQK